MPIPKRKDHKFTICGVQTLWRYTRLTGNADGWAYVGGDKPKVLIDNRLKKRSLLEVECHEFIHVANPTLDESHVTKQSHDLAVVLWSLGYRRTHEEEG